MLAYLRLPKDEVGLGSIAQVLAAEAMAASEGHGDLISIRDRARERIHHGAQSRLNRAAGIGQ